MSLLMSPRINLNRGPVPRLNVIAVFMFLVFFLPGLVLAVYMNNPIGVITGALLAFLAALSPKIAKQWERGIVLRLGKGETLASAVD